MDLFDRAGGQQDRLERLGRVRTADRAGTLVASHRSDVRERQEQRERAAGTKFAPKANFTAEQLREFARDSQTKSGTAVPARGARVGLLKRLENDFLLFGRNTDAGIRNRELDHRRRGVEDRMAWCPAVWRQTDLQAHAAQLGKFECIGQQVFQHLQQALLVGVNRAPELCIDFEVEAQLACLRFMAEAALDGLAQLGKRQVEALDRDRARFDLGQIENVADQIQQIGARSVNRARELDLARGEVAFSVVAQLLAEDQNRI